MIICRGGLRCIIVSAVLPPPLRDHGRDRVDRLLLVFLAHRHHLRREDPNLRRCPPTSRHDRPPHHEYARHHTVLDDDCFSNPTPE